MKFESANDEKAIRALLEGLSEAGSTLCLQTSTQCRAKILMRVLDSNSKAKGDSASKAKGHSAELLTAIWTKSTGQVQVIGGVAILDYATSLLKEIDQLYACALEGNNLPGPKGSETACNSFRCPPYSKNEGQETTEADSELWIQYSNVPRDPLFKAAIEDIASHGLNSLAGYSDWQRSFIKTLVQEYGLSPGHHTVNEVLGDAEAEEEEEEESWCKCKTMGGSAGSAIASGKGYHERLVSKAKAKAQAPKS